MRAVADGDVDLAAVGAILAEPARAKVLLALGDGRALPASMLATEAGVSPSTASHHLARLHGAGLITATTRGRHKYFALAGPHVAELIEAVARVAPPQPVTSLREGTRAHALRYARRCYDHLAGRLGVALADALLDGAAVSDEGSRRLARLKIDTTALRLCRDWTEQRDHVAGPLGKALLERLLAEDWLRQDLRTRALHVTPAGETELAAALGVRLP